MADAQSYKNHTRFFPPFHFFVMPVLLINVLNEARHLYNEPTRHFAWTLLFAIALLMLALTARLMAVAVQDRVIRLEMRTRLAQCLPSDLLGRANALTPRQLVALRFASDSEMADLVRDVLEGKLTTGKDIKMRVKDWQADHLRA
ncbi:MAG TPA: DUF6526 family protein [Vicinamibacterales bacterium]|nr:DUF6526 family protein [Vicinamibacterales bacterium]